MNGCAGPEAMVILSFRVRKGKRAAFQKFIIKAFKHYESPGGIRMSLYEDTLRKGDMVEIAAYDSILDYDSDQVRVERDPPTIRVLAEWRALLDGPPQVRLLKRVHTARSRSTKR